MPQKIDAPGSLRRSATLVLNVRDEAHRGRVIRWHSSRGRRAKVPALAGTRAGREPAALLPGGWQGSIRRASSFRQFPAFISAKTRRAVRKASRTNGAPT